MSEWDKIERRKNGNGVDFKIFAAETNIHLKAQCEKLDEIKTDIAEIKNSFTSLDKTTCLMIANVNERVTAQPALCFKVLRNDIWKIVGIVLGIPSVLMGVILIVKAFAK